MGGQRVKAVTLMRVHELAKELSLQNKDVIDKLKALGYEVKSHMSNLDENVVVLVRTALAVPSKTKPELKTKLAPHKAVKPGHALPADVDHGAAAKSAHGPHPSSAVPVRPLGGSLESIPVEDLEDVAPKKDLAKIVDETREKKHGREKVPSAKIADEGKIIQQKIVKVTTPISVPAVVEKRTLEIRSPIVVKELAEKLGVKPNELIAKLISLGVFASINQSLDDETAVRVAREYGADLIVVKREEKSESKPPATTEFHLAEDRPEDLRGRPPIVTFMGHVDHGKTSLLDYIRKTKVVAKEAGGITQHIGAYEVSVPAGKITFLDTPGHKAFTAMRARGAKITDVVVLVVAADDGVMPQTKEAIDHCTAAEVPSVAAVNKIDLPNVAPDKVRRQLAELGLQPEEWGGQTIYCDVSAKTGQGVDHLLEMLALQAEIMELKANPNRPANGVVVEAKLTKGRGPTVTVLVENGTLHTGDPILCGVYSGKVKALINDRGEAVRAAGPAAPVEILGLGGVPEAGAEFYVTSSEREAKGLSELRQHQIREKSWGSFKHTTLEDLYREIVEGEIKELRLIIKGDVQGSVEALVKSLEEQSTRKVAVKVIHGIVGDISETDVMLASASNGIIIGFHCKADAKIKELAKKEGVEIRVYNIIYDVVEDIRKAMEGMLEPKIEEVVIGHAHVRQVFTITKAGVIAGCLVKDGKIVRNGKARLLRDGKVIYQGDIRALKRFKDEVKEVKTDFECGIKLSGWEDLQVGDVIEAYQLEKTAQLL